MAGKGCATKKDTARTEEHPTAAETPTRGSATLSEPQAVMQRPPIDPSGTKGQGEASQAKQDGELPGSERPSGGQAHPQKEQPGVEASGMYP